MAELGMFEDQKVELLGGLVVEMSPQGNPHTEVLARLNELLVRRLHDRARVVPASSFELSEYSEPEPDIALVARRDYSKDGPNPADAFLLIEVSQSSLRKDRLIKAGLYAAAGVPEYWIVNLEDDQLEVHRAPTADGYAEVSIHRSGDRVAPVVFPDVSVAVAELIPAR